MLTPQMRETICQMHQKEISIRQISRLLGIHRNTVRKALRAQEAPQGKSSRYEKHLELIRELIARCRGNLVRVQECLEEEHGIQIPYPTLTWLVRHHQLNPFFRTASLKA